MDKTAIRQQVRAARRAFVAGLAPAARAGLERSLAAQVAPLLRGIIASYAARGSEIDPRFAQAGHDLVFPRVADATLSFHCAAYADLATGFGGILEPSALAPRAAPDVLLVPMSAADRAGNRIGQGGGYYDRALATIRAAGPVVAIGLAWDVQIVAEVPVDPWDEPLDWIATPGRLVDCRAHR